MLKAAFQEESTLTPALTLQIVPYHRVMLSTIQWPRSRALTASEISTFAQIGLQQILALAKIWHVLRNQPARLGHQRPKVAQNLKANGVFAVYFRVFRRPVNAWIEIFPIHFQRDKPGQVIDARAAIVHLLERHARVVRQLISGFNRRDAQANHLQ